MVQRQSTVPALGRCSHDDLKYESGSEDKGRAEREKDLRMNTLRRRHCEHAHNDYHRQTNQDTRDETADLPESCFECFHNSRAGLRRHSRLFRWVTLHRMDNGT